ncbi:hypothetical protein EMCRGX_G004511 [Ephydatia muelleri]
MKCSRGPDVSNWIGHAKCVSCHAKCLRSRWPTWTKASRGSDVSNWIYPSEFNGSRESVEMVSAEVAAEELSTPLEVKVYYINNGQVCSAYQRQAHVSSSSNGGLQRMLSLFHSLLTPLPLQRWENTHIYKLPLHLSTPGMVELCGYNPAKYNTHIGAVMYSSCQNRPSN